MDLAAAIVKSTRDVFTTMIMMDVGEEDPLEDEDHKTVQANLTSMVGLGGDIKGMLALHCTSPLATGVTGALLGMDVNDLDNDVKDAIGEIANMIAGNLKVCFADSDLDIALAIPTSVIGTSFSFGRPKGATMIVIPFTADTGRFWVELKFVQA